MKSQMAPRARSGAAHHVRPMFAVRYLVIGLATVMILAAPVGASNPHRAACGILSLAEVRALINFPVSIFVPGSFEPTTTRNGTVSTCTYVPLDAKGHVDNGRGASVTLVWAPNDFLLKSQQIFEKQHNVVGFKSGALASIWVGNPRNRTAEGSSGSKKLLAAVLQKL